MSSQENPQTTESTEFDESTSAAEVPSDTSATPKSEDLVTALRAEVKEKEAKYLYLYAEFENFKKRAIKERSDLVKFGWEPVARDLLQCVDNLELALAHVPPGTDQNWLKGLTMTLSHFKTTLGKQGVETVQSLEKPFDPNLHEAIAQAPSDQPEGTVVQEHQSGYTLHGRLLRPARVVVSTGQAAN